MLFSHPCTTTFANAQLNVRAGSSSVEQVSVFKYLSLMPDNHLTFASNCDTICKRVDQWTGLKWRIRNIIPESLVLRLYKSLIPHFQYCSHLYDGCNLSVQCHLHVSQNNALRAVLQAPARYPTEAIHTKTNVQWLDVESARCQLSDHAVQPYSQYTSGRFTFNLLPSYQNQIWGNKLPS